MSALNPVKSVDQKQQNYPVAMPVNTGLNLPGEGEWKHILSICDTAIRSGMLPSSVRTKEAAAIIALKSRELNLPFMVGFSQIFVLNGKPSMSAELIQSLARRNLPGLIINILETSDQKCAVEGIRPERGSKPLVITWDIEDAKRAGLLKNDTWNKYPAAMLRSRAITALLRILCPEALMGISYTPEELGATVDETGNVIETTSRALPSGDVQESQSQQEEVTTSQRKTAFESPKQEAPKQAPIWKGPSSDQLARLFAIAKSKGITSKDVLKDWIDNTFGFAPGWSLTELGPQEYQDICEELQNIIEEPMDTQAELSPNLEPAIVVKTSHPNAVPDPGLSQEEKNQWFKNRKV